MNYLFIPIHVAWSHLFVFKCDMGLYGLGLARALANLGSLFVLSNYNPYYDTYFDRKRPIVNESSGTAFLKEIFEREGLKMCFKLALSSMLLF